MNARSRIVSYLIFSLICLHVNPVAGDPPTGPPPPPGSHGAGGNGPPGAPIDGGVGVLLVLGTALGAWLHKKSSTRPPPSPDSR